MPYRWTTGLHRLCDRYGLNTRVYRDEDDEVADAAVESMTGGGAAAEQILLPL